MHVSVHDDAHVYAYVYVVVVADADESLVVVFVTR
jgi:hypothetical protein